MALKLERNISVTEKGRINQVVDAMAQAGHPGWAEVDKDQVTIKSSSGFGGSNTWCVEAPESCTPSRVAVNERNEDVYLLSRMMIAANAFANVNLGPKELAFGGDFRIAEWQGIGNAKCETPEMWAKVGKFLAQVHRIPIEWWNELKSQYIEEEPSLATYPEGSLAWPYIQRGMWTKEMEQLSDAGKSELATAYTTEHPIAGRIVTVHGDFHPGNIIDLGEDQEKIDGRRFSQIDFEFTCVSHAVYDCCHAYAWASKADKRKAFIVAYLEEIEGRTVGDEEIHSLQVEIELGTLQTWHSGGKLCPFHLKGKTEEEVLELVGEVKNFVQFVRESEDAQKELIKQGLEKYLDSGDNPLASFLKKQREQVQGRGLQEANEAATAFQEKLNTLEEAKEESPDLFDGIAWRQPKGFAHPLEIGKAAFLGLNSSFTAICWVRNEHVAMGDWHLDRQPIFFGDIDPEGQGKGWGDFKEHIFMCELRDENSFWLGYGWSDTCSMRVCRLHEWDHVAFVFDEVEGKKIIVNGELTKTKYGEGCKPYLGDETIWLGSGNFHKMGEFRGTIHGAMIFPKSLEIEQIVKLAHATRPTEDDVIDLKKVAQDSSAVFEERLLKREESKQEENPSLRERSVWQQPEGTALPIEIGKASDLGLNSSFTAMCWVKNTKEATVGFHKDRCPIFVGDLNPGIIDKEWHECNNKYFMCELRNSHGFCFGFGRNETLSKRVCRLNEWDHVTFIYNADFSYEGGKGKRIIVNGEDAGQRPGWPGESSDPYEGDETIWLGACNNHEYGDWEGQIQGAMFFKEVLSLEDIFELAFTTSPKAEAVAQKE